jgi:hypothetical protein
MASTDIGSAVTVLLRRLVNSRPGSLPRIESQASRAVIWSVAARGPWTAATT